MAEVKIQASKNGPLIVKGPVAILDSQGEVMREADQVALCRCGQSSNKPFCDGMHSKTGFESVCARQVSGSAPAQP
jgi:3-phenylpropionate/trans-cinnamate dioxygenase ferredoxin subunit